MIDRGDYTGARLAIRSIAPRIAIVSTILMLLFSAGACGGRQQTDAAGEANGSTTDEAAESGANSIDFVPLVHGAAPGGEVAEPVLEVVSTDEERAVLETRLGSADRAALEQVDLSAHVVIATFLGVQPTSGHDIEIQAMSVRDQILEVTVHTQTPDPGQPVRQGFETPYHLVQVDRESLDPERLSGYRMVNESGILLADGPVDCER